MSIPPEQGIPSEGAQASAVPKGEKRFNFNLATLFLVFAALTQLPPWLPAFPTFHIDSPDASWMAVLDYAYIADLYFGKEIIFNYGPWGFLYSRVYSPETFVPQLFCWSAIALLFVTAFRALGRSAPMGVYFLVGLFAIFTFESDVPPLRSADSALFSISFLVFLALATPQIRVGRVLKLLLIALLAFFGTMKFSMVFLSLPLLLVLDVMALREKRIPWFCLAYAAAFAVFFEAAGQPLGNLPDFIRGGWEISMGYSAGMHKFPGDNYRDNGMFTLFLAASIAAFAFMYSVEKKSDGKNTPLLLLGLLFFLFMNYKAGFVRHDRYHAMNAWCALSGALCFYTLRAYAVAKTRAQAHAMLILLVVVGVFMFIQRGQALDKSMGELVHETANTAVERVKSVKSVVADNGDNQYTERWLESMQQIAAALPFPDTGEDSVDIYPYQQLPVLANKMFYFGRPVFQSYQALTPWLEEKNTAFLRMPEAPQKLIVMPLIVDRRYPSLDDGASWPDILARYQPEAYHDLYAFLKKRDTPRKITFRPLGEQRVDFGAVVPAPTTQKPLWCEVRFPKNFLAAFARLLFKPPVVRMTVALPAQGREMTFRVIPALAQTGFVLSPLVSHPLEFLSLFPDQPPAAWNPVSMLRFDTDGYGKWYFKAPLEVTFSELDVE